MRKGLIAGLAATAMLAQQGMAMAACLSPSDETAFQIEALKSEMMVLATGCHDDTQYNDFIRHYQPTLQTTEHRVHEYFMRTYGRTGQAHQDSYVTSLANAQSDLGLSLGSDFCSRNVAVFSEAMSLPTTTDLPAYVAGKDIVPRTLGTCEPERASVRRAVVHRYIPSKRR